MNALPPAPLLALAFALGLSLPAADLDLVWPLPDWTPATPRNVGLDEGQLAAARDYALTGGGSGYIIRHGRLVFAWGDPKQRYDLKSTTKSFGAAALGLAIQDGKVRLSDRARAHHPTLGTLPKANLNTGWLDEITLLHLASQTAGFDKPGGYVPLLFQPGTAWAYSDSGPNWLAECLTLAYRRDLDELMFERLFTPLGIQRADLVWRQNQYRPDLLDGLKRREFGAGISANVDAMARFGLLWLRGGEWNGAQLLPREFVRQAATTVPGVPGLPVRKPEEYGRAADHYGLLWWNNADGTLAGVPRDTYWTWGLYDSLIVVMPSLDVVVARAGQSWKRTAGTDHYDVLKPFLLPIVAAASAKPAPGREPSQSLAACEFLVRLDTDGEPVWTKDIARRGAVFTHPGRCYRSGVSFNAAPKRYLWVQILPQSRHPQGPRFQGGLGVSHRVTATVGINRHEALPAVVTLAPCPRAVAPVAKAARYEVAQHHPLADDACAW